MIARHTLLCEPTGDVYWELLDYARTPCDRFSLVERTELAFDESAQRVLGELRAFLGEERSVSEWPGTKLLGRTATLRIYELTAASTQILAKATTGLYGWRQPEHPEDLILWRRSGGPWLVSIAHERDAFLEIDSSECDELLQEVPLALKAG